jgi:hypothetical protein
MNFDAIDEEDPYNMSQLIMNNTLRIQEGQILNE